jgi:hypothetical protein
MPDGVRLFVSVIVVPAIALFGILAAVQGWARLSSRREWANVTPEEYKSAKLKLGVFVAAYPVLWLLTRYVLGLSTDVQLLVLGICSVVLLIWGVVIGHGFRVRATAGEEN